LLREKGVPPWRVVSGDDGLGWFGGAVRLGARALITPNVVAGESGYVQLLARLLAVASRHLPIDLVAPFFAVSGAIVTTACSFAVFWFTRDLIPSRTLRTVLALAPTLHPIMGIEVLGNVSGAMYPAAFACFWALIHEPRSRRDTMLSAAICFGAVLSYVLTLVYLPLALYLGYRRRTPWSAVVVGGFAVGAAIQSAAVLFSSSASNQHVHSVGDLLRAYVVRVMGTAALGEVWLRGLWGGGRSFPIAVLLALGSAGLVAFLLLRSSQSARVMGGICLVYSPITFAAAAWGRGTTNVRISGAEWSIGTPRYVYLPLLLFLSGVFILVSHATISRLTLRIVSGAIALHFAVLVVPAFRMDNFRSRGPAWDNAVAAARRSCEEGHRKSVRVQIPPVPFYTVPLPCWRLERSD